MVQEACSSAPQPLHVQEDKVVAGPWSKDVMALAAQSGRLRAMLRAGQQEKARDLLQVLSVEEQAALVAFDENPEEVLSLTGMDESGRPAYRPDVVDLLPTEILTELLVPRAAALGRFNEEVLRAMSPETFARAMSDTLEPVDQQELRTRISWEWLEAVAALDNPVQAAALLRQADPELLQEAVFDRLDELDLGAVAGLPTSVASVSRFQVFDEGLSGGRPGEYVEDPETAAVLDALYEAAPEVLTQMVRRAARRTRGWQP
jgi:hypothetical protein